MAPRRDLRRQAPLFLAISLLLFAALAGFTLMLYREGVERLLTDRRAEASRMATTLAERMASRPGITLAEASPLLPTGARVALLDERGREIDGSGFVDPGRSLIPGPPSGTASSTLGPDRDRDDRLLAWAPFSIGSKAEVRQRRWIRLELPEPALSAQRRTVQLLTPFVLVLSLAAAVLAIRFLHALFRPIEELIDRARVVNPSGSRAQVGNQGNDDLAMLFSTFDRALEALRTTETGSSGDRGVAERNLADSVTQLGELSAGVAHELRNSLGTLRGYLDLVGRSDLTDRAREDLGEASREAVSLGRVVDDFLTFARPRELPVQRVDLGSVLQRAVADPSLRHGRFETSVPPEPVWVLADERLLQRAIRNLLLNAMQAQARAESTVPTQAQLERGDDGVTLTIRDFGPGIDPSIRERLFQPFASSRSDGAGLGLALARRVALLHGGTLDLDDAGDGALATFRFPGHSAT